MTSVTFVSASTRETYPRLEAVRNKGGDRALFGPYDSASTLRHTLQIVNKHFQLRTRSDHVLRTRKLPASSTKLSGVPRPVSMISKMEATQNQWNTFDSSSTETSIR